MKLSRCMCNFACQGREAYLVGQARLCKTYRAQKEDADNVLTYTSTYPPGCPTHKEVPYAFKYHVMQEAFKKGHDLVLWLDASCVIRSSLNPLWDVIHKNGIILFNNPGCMENVFTSEDCLKQLGCSLSDAKRINQICGGVVGFNRHNQKAMRIFNRMMELSRDGISFQGGRNTSSDPKFHSHRHDQSCLSYLAVTHGLRVQPFNWVRYSYDSRGLDGCIIELRGMCG